MPIYEYRCKDCHQVFEEWCKHIEDGKAILACPICKGEAERLISNTSFSLKGDGWYVTEYGYRKGKDDTAAAGSGNADKAGSGDAATATPASAPESAPAPASSAASPSPAAPASPAASQPAAS